jgi:hypothetical protein
MAYQADRRRNTGTLYVDKEYFNDLSKMPKKQVRQELDRWNEENYRISNSSQNPLIARESLTTQNPLNNKEQLKEMKTINPQLTPYIDEDVTAPEETLTDAEKKARLNTAEKRRNEMLKRALYTQDRSKIAAIEGTEHGRISPFDDRTKNGNLLYRYDSGRISTFDKYTPEANIPLDTPDIYTKRDMQVRRPSINIDAFKDAPIASSSRDETPRIDAFGKPIMNEDRDFEKRHNEVYNPERGRINSFTDRQRDEDMHDIYRENDPVSIKPFQK